VRVNPNQPVKDVAGAVLQRNFDAHPLISSQAPQPRSAAQLGGGRRFQTCKGPSAVAALGPLATGGRYPV
jgi:hypothetical protein